MSRQAPAAPAAGAESRNEEISVRVWDLPTRVVHWMLVLLFAASWYTGEYGLLAWHRWSGYMILGLVLFRLYWGFVGSSTARFSHFIKGPGAVWGYSRTLFKRAGSKVAGHNPMGGWSVAAMVFLLLLQTGLGLFSVDVDGIESGPLAALVSFDTGRSMASWHGKVMDALLVLIVLHVAVVLHYWFYKRDNLIPAMFTGIKRLPAGTDSHISFATLWRAVIGLAAAALLVTALVTRLGF